MSTTVTREREEGRRERWKEGEGERDGGKERWERGRKRKTVRVKWRIEGRGYEGRSEGRRGRETPYLSLFLGGSSTIYRMLQNVSWKPLTALQERRHFRCTRTLLVIVS